MKKAPKYLVLHVLNKKTLIFVCLYIACMYVQVYVEVGGQLLVSFLRTDCPCTMIFEAGSLRSLRLAN